MRSWQPQVGRVQRGQRGALRTIQQLVKSGKLDEAQAALRKVVTENPEFALARLMLGNTYFRQRRYDEALAEYQQALQHNQRLAPAPLMMGMIYRTLKEPKNALEHFELALEIDPELVVAHVQKGRLHASQGQVNEAVASAKKALAGNPQAIPARLLLAEIHAQSNEEHKALEILDDLIKDQPELVVANMMLGMLYLKLGRLEEAKASLQTVTQLSPERPFVFYVLGNVHQQLRELNAAEKCYRDALSIREDFLPGRYALADVLTASKRYTEAVGILNGILSRSRRTNSVHQRLGAIYVIQGRYARAVEEFRAAVKRDPEIMAMDPSIEGLLESGDNEERIANAFMERLKAIRIQQASDLKSTPFRDWMRRRRERNAGRPRAQVS